MVWYNLGSTRMRGRMAEDGYVFYLSENGVWLVKEVPAKYLETAAASQG